MPWDQVQIPTAMPVRVLSRAMCVGLCVRRRQPPAVLIWYVHTYMESPRKVHQRPRAAKHGGVTHEVVFRSRSARLLLCINLIATWMDLCLLEARTHRPQTKCTWKRRPWSSGDSCSSRRIKLQYGVRLRNTEIGSVIAESMLVV